MFNGCFKATYEYKHYLEVEQWTWSELTNVKTMNLLEKNGIEKLNYECRLRKKSAFLNYELFDYFLWVWVFESLTTLK